MTLIGQLSCDCMIPYLLGANSIPDYIELFTCCIAMFSGTIGMPSCIIVLFFYAVPACIFYTISLCIIAGKRGSSRLPTISRAVYKVVLQNVEHTPSVS